MIIIVPDVIAIFVKQLLDLTTVLNWCLLKEESFSISRLMPMELRELTASI
jgi:hypothetical protein